MNTKRTDLASLYYIYDSIPGISRQRRGKAFIYFHPNNSRVVEPYILERIHSLAIPPAYKEVWISPIANGHIQATARDSRNRKQYRYHPLWCELREENKFISMLEFGKALPKIRKHIEYQLSKPLKNDKKQIICAIIYLLDHHLIRIGNLIYEKENRSYGLTTLRKKHLSFKEDKAILKFNGKNSKIWKVILQDKKIIKLLKKCEAIPGYRLFKYLDEDNNYYEITSQDINNYLQELTKHAFTAKDFRTWGACREVFYKLSQLSCANEISAKKTLNRVIAEVATILGHTAAICQKSYIYPEIIRQWKEKKITAWRTKHARSTRDKDKLLLRWLEKNG